MVVARKSAVESHHTPFPYFFYSGQTQHAVSKLAVLCALFTANRGQAGMRAVAGRSMAYLVVFEFAMICIGDGLAISAQMMALTYPDRTLH